MLDEPDRIDRWERGAAAPRRRRGPGLSYKLLLLTGLFVMIGTVFIALPSIAAFQRGWLDQRLESARVAAIAVMSESRIVPIGLGWDLLDEIGGTAVVAVGDVMRLIAMPNLPEPIARTLDVRTFTPMVSVEATLRTLFRPRDGSLQIIGPFEWSGPGHTIQITMPHSNLTHAVYQFSRDLAVLALIVSAVTAALVWLAIRRLFVAPMLNLVAGMRRFAEAPEDAATIQPPSQRGDEFGSAERRLRQMQLQLHEMLTQRRRLADLGLAVTKINHDLRNLLASAQLVTERLSDLPDPTVQRLAPRLVGAVDRAIAYCTTVLSYGKAREPAPNRRQVDLAALGDEVAELVGIDEQMWDNRVPAGLVVDADAEMLLRIFINLARNAKLALETMVPRSADRRIVLEAQRRGSVVTIRMADTGPGLPAEVREHLFEPFRTARHGGTGLGLSIAAELVHAHGGTITLVEAAGTVFEIAIPDRPIDMAARRSRMG